MIDRFEGSPGEIKAEVERIVQTIVPEATCEISDDGEQISCGTVDASGRTHEFSLLIGNLDRAILEANARTLESALTDQSPERAFEGGYRDGSGSVAGNVPMPECPTCPPAEEWRDKTPFQLGFEYGRADALERLKPGSGDEGPDAA
ncbi:MAG: hypothetical protein ACR2KH_00555 [Sphingomicrobium sp.]